MRRLNWWLRPKVTLWAPVWRLAAGDLAGRKGRVATETGQNKDIAVLGFVGRTRRTLREREREGDKWRYLKVGKIPPYKGWVVTWSTRSLQQNTRYIQKYTREYSNISLIVFTRDLSSCWGSTRQTQRRDSLDFPLSLPQRSGRATYSSKDSTFDWFMFRLCWFDRGSRVALLILGFLADFWNRLCIFLLIVA